MSHLREPGSSALHGGYKLVCLGWGAPRRAQTLREKPPFGSTGSFLPRLLQPSSAHDSFRPTQRCLQDSPHLLAPATPSPSLRLWGPAHLAHSPAGTGSFASRSSPKCRKLPAVFSPVSETARPAAPWGHSGQRRGSGP